MNDSESGALTVGEGVVVKLASELVVPGDIELKGEIVGHVQCKDIRIGPDGKLTGSLSASRLVVEGEISSEVAAESVILRESSRAVGIIEYGSIQIEAGAQIEAKLTEASSAPVPDAISH
ncbi:MAG: polymer-forming cytoskeletal protein [Spiribacter sp.]|nr:polymer-forming cytoskeletal protein [Spiribacter sp.]MDR9455535.1 polymer-forming cytoskeletal protein [Spiribacter sp.]